MPGILRRGRGRCGALVGEQVENGRRLAPEGQPDEVVRLPAVMGLVVEQVGEHVVERLRLRRAAARSVVEGAARRSSLNP
jgi:hypothetical protein